MNRNIRIARRLVMLAKILVAFNRKELETQLKRTSLSEDKIEEHLDCLEGMGPKEQKVALFWISKKRLILPEDLSKFNDAMNLINKQHLDFQKFDGPMEVVNRNDKSTLRIKSQDIHFSPSSEKSFSHPYNAGDGVVIYDVEDSREGQLAVRRAIDSNWGYDKNPWCLAARKDGFDPDEVEQLTEEQKEELGLSSDDDLAVAWNYWKHYNAYPKRIAFKSGKLLAFSAGREKQHIEWWDKNDKSHYTIPESNAVDDIEFLKRHGKLNLMDSNNASPEMIEELAEDEDWNVIYGVARHPNTPAEILRKLAEDKYILIKKQVAMNPSTPAEVLMKLAEDKIWEVREGVAYNSSTPAEAFMKLAEDENRYVRSLVARNPSTHAEALMKLADDKDAWVREKVVKNPNTPAEVLRKLAEDKDRDVRKEVAENSYAPAEALMKLAEDKDVDVRQRVAENPSTPVEVLRKLSKDKRLDVRAAVVYNPNTPVEVLMKLAEDKVAWVREKAKSHLQQ